MSILLYDLIDIDDEKGAGLLDRYQLQPAALEIGDKKALAHYFQQILKFSEVHSGVADGKVGVSAALRVKHVGLAPMGFSLLPLAPIYFTLRDHGDPDEKTRVFCTEGDLGRELVFDALKLDIQVPASLLQPHQSEAERQAAIKKGGAEVKYGTAEGNLFVVLRDQGFSTISVDVRVRVTEENEVIFEPLVPISIGACRLFDLPCRSVHDLGLLFSPKLRGSHEDERALEWTRHALDLGGSGLNHGGLLTLRTLDLDLEADPLKSLIEKLNQGRAKGDRARFVLEDLALPLTITQSLPIPAHGTFALRRHIDESFGAERSFSFDDAPISVELPGTRLIIEQLVLRTVGDIATDTPLLIDLRFLIGADAESTLAAGVTAKDTELEVSRGDAFPDPLKTNKPFVATVYGPPLEDRNGRPVKERIRVDARDAKTLSDVKRGVLRSTAHAFSEGSRVTLSTNAVGVEISDEWTLALSYSNAYGLTIAKLFGVTVKLWGAKLGASLGRIFSRTRSYSALDCMLVLFDLSIEIGDGKKKEGKASWLEIRSSGNGPSEITLHNLGLRLGSFNLDSLSTPEGIEIVIFQVFKLRIDDLSWVTENNGAQYISVTGGISLFPTAGAAKKTPSESQSKTKDADKEQSADKGFGGGLSLLRLRGKVAGSESAPDVLIDGISLELYLGVVEILGYGVVGGFEEGGNRYEEFGFELKLKVDTKAVKFETQLTIFYGKVSGKDNFQYWLAGFRVSSIPCGPIALHNVQALVANNLTPDITKDPDSDAGNLQLFNWYKSKREVVLSLKGGRKLPAWKRMNDSLSVGAGAGVTLPCGDSISIDLFVFYARNPADEAFFVLLELYLFGGKSPAAFGAVEYNLKSGAWGVLLGIELDILSLLSKNRKNDVDRIERKDKGNSPSAKLTLKLTGTIYFGNPPKAIMIGKLADQDTWLTLKIEYDLTIVEFLLLVALGFEYRDTPKGPKAGGLIFKLKAGGILPIGTWSVFINLGLIIGVWRNESNNFGVHFFIEGGFRFKVFFIFTLGVVALLDVDYIDPDYTKLLVTIRFELPWFLPSFQFTFEKVWKTIQLDSFAAISTPMIRAAALQVSTKRTQEIGLSRLNPAADDKAIFSLNDLRGFTPVTSLPLGSELVPVDAVITVDFKCSVNDRLAPGENTPTRIDIKSGPDPVKLPEKDVGTQKVNDIEVSYTLVGMSIQRRPRFAPETAWTDVLREQDTTIYDLDDALSGSVKFDQKANISLYWDRDLRRDGLLDPRRLLINAELPYSYATDHPQGDEERVRGAARWPCCSTSDDVGRNELLLHRLDFRGHPSGRRLGPFQLFSDSFSVLNWVTAPLPLVVDGRGGRSARVPFGKNDQVVAWVTFNEPVHHCLFNAFYLRSTPGLSATVAFELFDGELLIHTQEVNGLTDDVGIYEILGVPGNKAFSRARVRLKSRGTSGGDVFDSKERIEIVSLAYLSYEDARANEIRRRKCASDQDRVTNGSGKFAWLPNHVYRISLSTEITLKHDKNHTQPHVTSQLVQFATKGLPGLNAVARVGDEIEPFIEGYYPKGGPEYLYRREGTAIVFNASFNILSPVIPHRGFWQEHAQTLEWTLTVDSPDGARLRHLSQTDKDWLSANYGRFDDSVPRPADLGKGEVLSESKVQSGERRAVSLDSLRQRLERAMAQLGSCAVDQPIEHQSQILRHGPVGEVLDGAPLWESQALLRLNLRQRHAPFIERASFLDGDAGAFESMGEAPETPVKWRSDRGVMRIGEKPEDKPADSVRRYAAFGEPLWDHLQVSVRVDPQGGEAGLAFAVHVVREVEGNRPPTVDQGILVLIAAQQVRVIERRTVRVVDGSTYMERQLGESLHLPEDAKPPFLLEVIAYDDVLRVSVGDKSLDVARDNLREGQLALVNENGGAFSSLSVAGLDAYRREFQVSRYVDFRDHIADYDGELSLVPAVTSNGALDLGPTIATMRSQTFEEWERVRTDIHEREARQRLFTAWVGLLSLPVQRESERLGLTLLVKDRKFYALLLESPEPLPFSRDVTTSLYQITWSRPTMEVPNAPPLGQFVSYGKVLEGVFTSSKDLVPPRGPYWLAVARLNENGALEYRLYSPAKTRLDGRRLYFRGELNRILSPAPDLEIGLETLRALDTLMLEANQFAFVDGAGNILHGTKFVNQDMVETTLGSEVLSDGDERAALIFPVERGGPSAFGTGLYRLRLDLNRQRYRAAVAGPDQVYTDTAALYFNFDQPT